MKILLVILLCSEWGATGMDKIGVGEQFVARGFIACHWGWRLSN